MDMAKTNNVGKTEHKLLEKSELQCYLFFLDKLSNQRISRNLPISELMASEIAKIRLRGEIYKALQWK